MIAGFNRDRTAIDNLTPNGWYNRGAFVETRSELAIPGETPRLLQITPSMPKYKNFVMPHNEHHSGSVRAEAFNALNHPNFAGPRQYPVGRNSRSAGDRPHGFWHH
jgi:hypothetical protein